MRLRDLMEETWEALEANRGRSLLTILGIVIGISAVIAMTALIAGVRESLMGELGLSQARVITMAVYGSEQIKADDLQKIADGMPEYEFVTGMSYGSDKVASDDVSEDASITGVAPRYFETTGQKVTAGRVFTSGENDAASTVALLDEASAHKLFKTVDYASVVGRSVRIKGIEYRVAGVLEGGQAGGGLTVYVPLRTCAQRVNGYDGVDQAVGMAREGEDIDSLVEKTKGFLKKQYHLSGEDADDSLYVTSMKSQIDQVNSVMGTFQLLMTSVAAISLVVGGIGIMNMMLTNVTERIREIGLRKALGARRVDITRQFLLESVCLTLAGGAFGIVLGYAGAFALSSVATSLMGAEAQGMSIRPVIEPAAVAAVTGVCVAIGLVFGYYPAHRAARLDPVESLHYQ